MANYDGSCVKTISQYKESHTVFGMMFWKGELLWTSNTTVRSTSVQTGKTTIQKTLQYNVREMDYFGDTQECKFLVFRNGYF